MRVASAELHPNARLVSRHSLPGLDGVRGIAILLVMVFHFAWMKPGSRFDGYFYSLAHFGWSGVDLFFVLSGFLITGILIDAKGANNYLRNFYARRALRIFPLYYTFAAALMLLFPLVGGEKVAKEALILQQNQWWLWTHMMNWLVAGVGDFWTATPLGTGGFWSLAIEEQFYLVWPIVILLVPPQHLLRLCLALIAGATAVRFAMVGLGASWAAIFTVTFARKDAIAMGAAIAVIARSPAGLSSVKRLAIPIAAVALIGLGACEFLSRSGHPLRDTLALALHCTLFVWLWGSLVVATLTAAQGGYLQRLTYARPLRSLGKYSFALYLFHGHFNRLFERLGFNPNSSTKVMGSVLPMQILYLTLAISASFAAAYLSWHLFEKHFLRLKVFFPRSRGGTITAAGDALQPSIGGPHKAPSHQPATTVVVPRNNNI